VVIYSDGVTEAQNQNHEFFGKKRLRDIVNAHAKESCGAIHDAIQAGVAAFTEGAAQSDDITVVVLEYRGRANSGRWRSPRERSNVIEIQGIDVTFL